MSNFKHGQKGTRLYRVWKDMIARCENPNHKYYKDYGGRGIKVCAEWRNSFITFRKWALTHGYKHYLTIDRIDNDGDYKPENCRFATMTIQNRNSRQNKFIIIGNKKKLLIEWAEQAGLKYHTLWRRLHRGWPESRLLEPVKR